MAKSATPDQAGAVEPPSARLRHRLHAAARRVPPQQWLAIAVTAIIVGGVTLFTLTQLQPDLLVADTTPTGGDMGAHVWGPAYLRDTLLPQGRLTGWTPDWYAGFPAYQFYMVVPSLLIVALDVLLPYGVAFKLVTVLGVLTLPAAAWAFGRLSGLRHPGPALLAAATVPFLFDREFTIYGGNMASTMAGEFAFSISLSLAVLYLGVVANGLETGRRRALAAVLLALTGLCHLIPAFFALAGTAVLFLLRWGWARLRWVAVVGPVAGLLSAFWVLPFYARRAYVNDMGWEKIQPWSDHSLVSFAWLARVGDSLWHEDIRWFVAFALIGAVIAVAERNRTGAFLAIMAVIFAAAFVLAPQGRLWNARLLPFYYLMVYLLSGYAVAELCRAVARQYSRRGDRPLVVGRALVLGLGSLAVLVVAPRLGEGAGRLGSLALTAVEAVAVVAIVAVGLDLVRIALVRGFGRPTGAEQPVVDAAAPRASEVGGRRASAEGRTDAGDAAATGPPFDRSRIEAGIGAVAALGATLIVVIVVAMPLQALPGGSTTAAGDYRWLGFETAQSDLNFVDGWARWNYQGYERKAGNDSGGGYDEYHGIVTTMAGVGDELGCGRAMWEYESELDRYGTPMALMLLPFWTDGCIGSMEGLFFEASATTPYHFLNQSELSAAPSRAQRDLPYSEFDIDEGVEHLQLMGVRYYLAFSDTALAAARDHADLTEVASSEPWTVFEVADAELVTPLEYEPAVLNGVTDAGEDWLGPSTDWYTDGASRDVLLASTGPEEWVRSDVGDEPTPVPVDPVEVSAIDTTDDSISFDVNEIGRPVLVKASYFPNWEVTGGDGPYRVTPNLMVVVPTAEHVELHYGHTTVDIVAWILTGLGLVAVIVLARRPDPVMPAAAPVRPEPLERPEATTAESVPVESELIGADALIERSPEPGSESGGNQTEP